MSERIDANEVITDAELATLEKLRFGQSRYSRGPWEIRHGSWIWDTLDAGVACQTKGRAEYLVALHNALPKILARLHAAEGAKS